MKNEMKKQCQGSERSWFMLNSKIKLLKSVRKRLLQGSTNVGCTLSNNEPSRLKKLKPSEMKLIAKLLRLGLPWRKRFKDRSKSLLRSKSYQNRKEPFLKNKDPRNVKKLPLELNKKRSRLSKLL